MNAKHSQMLRKTASSPIAFVTLRERVGLSQELLAAEFGVDRSTIWRWESGSIPIPKMAVFALRYLELEQQLHQQYLKEQKKKLRLKKQKRLKKNKRRT